ncbi:MAG: ATPase [bacterium]
MHVVFVAPHFPANQREFVRALKSVGAQVTGIGEWAGHDLDYELRSWLDGYEQVQSVCDLGQLYGAVRRIQSRGWVDRLEATIESHILPAAKVRAACTIPGLTPEAAEICRDKALMKEVLRKGGIPCARSARVSSRAEGRDFAEAVGFPLIVKPLAGAGAAGTSRVDDQDALDAALVEAGVAEGSAVAVEEFIEGHEGFYDTLTVNGRVEHHFISHYYPGVLHAMRTRWISPQIVSTNRVDAPGYDEVRALGDRVIELLGLDTCATHMEWFFGPKGLKFSEIGARPPGVRQWDLYNFGNEMDLYREWAMALVHGRVSQQPSRRYASGLIAKRPDRDGRIAGYGGLAEVQAKVGEWIIDAHLPSRGTPTQPVEAGFMANAWVRMRHPDYDTLRSMMDFVGRTLHCYAEG